MRPKGLLLLQAAGQREHPGLQMLLRSCGDSRASSSSRQRIAKTPSVSHGGSHGHHGSVTQVDAQPPSPVPEPVMDPGARKWGSQGRTTAPNRPQQARQGFRNRGFASVAGRQTRASGGRRSTSSLRPRTPSPAPSGSSASRSRLVFGRSGTPQPTTHTGSPPPSPPRRLIPAVGIPQLRFSSPPPRPQRQPQRPQSPPQQQPQQRQRRRAATPQRNGFKRSTAINSEHEKPSPGDEARKRLMRNPATRNCVPAKYDRLLANDRIPLGAGDGARSTAERLKQRCDSVAREHAAIIASRHNTPQQTPSASPERVSA
eukprot:TRINITY_DN2780_c2_g2_i2.p1 TRINITY_DN2780_c2_g2~~TRINITY_DN2780_c2_g2_i2.p1  ORF type:complete len:315 (+),score=31.21 TRINITY_DN2780_c2_g2_i2:80-1024(+)